MPHAVSGCKYAVYPNVLICARVIVIVMQAVQASFQRRDALIGGSTKSSGEPKEVATRIFEWMRCSTGRSATEVLDYR